MSTCVNGCEKPLVGRGFCRRCYVAWHRSIGGSVADVAAWDRPSPLKDGDPAAFMARVRKTDGCWYWEGHLRPDGYGSLCWKGRNHRRAHRVSYEIHVGTLGEREVLRHTCDNPPCVNPAHLLPGAHADNVQDKVDRGRARGNSNWGESHNMVKLTAEQVREIRRRRSNGEILRTIAVDFGISRTTVCDIAKGKSWSKLP